MASVLRQYLAKKGIQVFTSEAIAALKGDKGKVT
ncbi:MAG: hypothetical protein K6T83_17535, partial [Alicyclobacillus sp.]|nr:hypothetical protein [Alicyclobacillus sp.]